MEENENKQNKVLFVGGVSTGKSTLQTALIEELRKRGVDVSPVHEYARDYQAETGAYADAFERFVVYLGSHLRSRQAPDADLLVYDDAPFINVAYGRVYRPDDHPLIDKWQRGLEHIEDLERENVHEFAAIYLLPSGVFPAVNDDVRKDAENQEKIGNEMIRFIEESGANYHTIQASGVAERVAEVIADLENRAIISPGEKR
jgi:nicotinamide riboside kinase